MGRDKHYHEPLAGSFNEILTAIADEQKPDVRIVARPFVKWVGGKRSIIPQLLERMPNSYTTYYEPFVGGGALYFAIQPESAYLSDVNFHLVITYTAIRDRVDDVIRKLKVHTRLHNKEYYLKARARMLIEKDEASIAALFIYLNKTCFNGLYRVNKSGQFNVPMGDYKVPPILDEVNLRNTSTLLQDADIRQQEFWQIKPKSNAFYYLDPPYHETYSSYDGSGFGDAEHANLAEFCKSIHTVGGYFMLSNSDTPYVRSLYKGFNIEEVSASRSVSCKAHQRGKETELIIRNYAH